MFEQVFARVRALVESAGSEARGEPACVGGRAEPPERTSG
jgi:hypothetical protein